MFHGEIAALLLPAPAHHRYDVVGALTDASAASRQLREPHSVRPRGMQFEGRFINPLRMASRTRTVPQRFKYVNAQATSPSAQ